MTATRNNIGALLADAAGRLRELGAVGVVGADAGCARVEALALMRKALEVGDNAMVLARDDECPDAESAGKFATMLARRLRGEPVAYILGRREFYGRDFMTDSRALIPRPETELLVELGVGFLRGRGRARVLDLGTGCGAVGLSIFLETAGEVCRMVLTDNDSSALDLARLNASRLGVVGGVGGVDFRLGDFYKAVDGAKKREGGEGGAFDLIVCNPPYISEGDACLLRGDLRFEPRGALASGADGLSALRTVICGAPDFMRAGGCLIVEHGAEQGADCRRMALASGFASAETIRDLAGLERATMCKVG